MVDIPGGKHPVGCKWVQGLKYHHEGTIVQCKAHLVAKGFTQVYGEAYLEIYSSSQSQSSACDSLW